MHAINTVPSYQETYQCVIISSNTKMPYNPDRSVPMPRCLTTPIDQFQCQDALQPRSISSNAKMPYNPDRSIHSYSMHYFLYWSSTTTCIYLLLYIRPPVSQSSFLCMCCTGCPLAITINICHVYYT